MLEKLTRRDRIALMAAAAAIALFLALNFGVLPALGQFAQSAEDVEQKELALRRDQRLLANAGLERINLSAAQDRLNSLEGGLLESPSLSLAHAEWQRRIGQLADSQGIQLGSSEFLRVQSLSPQYALVTGRLQFQCRIDQLVDFLVAAAASPKHLSVTHVTIAVLQGDAQGRVNVQLIMGAAVRALQPEKSPTAP
jgi:hypothetical protein